MATHDQRIKCNFEALPHFQEGTYNFNPFSTIVPLLYPLKTSNFLMFLGDIEVEHWFNSVK